MINYVTRPYNLEECPNIEGRKIGSSWCTTDCPYSSNFKRNCDDHGRTDDICFTCNFKKRITRSQYQEIIQTKLLPLIHEKFEESYPDTFVKCRTTNKDIYDSSNGCMYSWYLKIINSLNGEPTYSPAYQPKFDESIFDYDYSIIEAFIDDLERRDNWQEFLIHNIKLN